MLAGVPLAFTLSLDAGAVDEEVQWAGATAIGQAHVQSSLAPTQGAEIWYGSVQASQPQETFHETCGLPEWHPEQDFHR